MSTPEGILSQGVNKVLASPLGARWPLNLRLNSGQAKIGAHYVKLCPEGTADRLLGQLGRTIWLELKAPGQATKKSRREAQDAFGEMVRSIGHEYHRITSVEELIAVLEGN